MMQSMEEGQEIPKEEAAVMPVEEPRKRLGSGFWLRSAARSGRKGPAEKVDQGESRLPPVGRYPDVQK
jgi:hypothetical protein